MFFLQVNLQLRIIKSKLLKVLNFILFFGEIYLVILLLNFKFLKLCVIEYYNFKQTKLKILKSKKVQQPLLKNLYKLIKSNLTFIRLLFNSSSYI